MFSHVGVNEWLSYVVSAGPHEARNNGVIPESGEADSSGTYFTAGAK
jgi:hypothetical protein